MNCPKCHTTELEDVTVDEVSMNRCRGCNGMWVAFSEFDKIMDNPPEQIIEEDRKITPEETDATLKCPSCDADLIRLRSIENKDVVMGACVVCYGRWLDGGELARLQKKGVIGRFKDFLRKHSQ